MFCDKSAVIYFQEKSNPVMEIKGVEIYLNFSLINKNENLNLYWRFLNFLNP